MQDDDDDDKRCSPRNEPCSMSLTVGGANGIIFISASVGNKLYFKNSGGVIGNSSEIALYSLETQTLHQQGVVEHQPISVGCSVLNITADDAGILRHFFIPAGRSFNNIHFNKLYFKPVRQGWGRLEEIYFECTNKAVILKHIVLLHRRRR